MERDRIARKPTLTIVNFGPRRPQTRLRRRLAVAVRRIRCNSRISFEHNVPDALDGAGKRVILSATRKSFGRSDAHRNLRQEQIQSRLLTRFAAVGGKRSDGEAVLERRLLKVGVRRTIRSRRWTVSEETIAARVIHVGIREAIKRIWRKFAVLDNHTITSSFA